MKRSFLPVVLASTLPFATQASQAASTDDPVIVIGEVRVSAQRSGGPLLSNSVLTSVDVLGADKIEDKNVMNSWELVGQLPGVQLTETRMGAESGKATFRAFNGEGYINGIKVLIDGIPSNVNSGNQRFIDMIFPLEIDYIEVVRGTNDPRYGLHNIGGNIGFGTRQGGNYTEGRFTYGSFATRELQLALGGRPAASPRTTSSPGRHPAATEATTTPTSTRPAPNGLYTRPTASSRPAW